MSTLRELIALAKKAKDQPSPDVANVSDAEYKLVCRFQSAIPELEALLAAAPDAEGETR